MYLCIDVYRHNQLIVISLDGFAKTRYYGYNLRDAIKRYRTEYSLRYKHLTKIVNQYF